MSPPKPRRRWLQFRLRTLLIAVTLVSLPLGYVAWEREQCRQGQQAMEILEQRSEYDGATRRLGRLITPSYEHSKWLKSILGDDEFRRVITVSLEGNSVSDSDLQVLAIFPNLDFVVIESQNVTDEGIAHLRGLKKVERFHFIGNWKVSENCWEVLGRWHHLRELSFHDSLFDDDDVLTLPALLNLKELRLSQTIISDAGLERISWLTSLESLDLSSTQVSDTGLVHLRRLVNLKELSVKNTNVTDKGVKELQKALPKTFTSY